MVDNEKPVVGFVLEQTLGHVTHSQNLRTIIPHDRRVEARWQEVPWDVDGVGRWVPGFRSNWTARAGLRARRAIRRMAADGRLDALFIHTQVPAVLAAGWMRRVPTVVSVDATPLQYDELGDFYQHQRGTQNVETLKWRANAACFHRAQHLVSWSHWAKAGLVRDYGVPAERITVIPPGVDASAWARADRQQPASGRVIILFVGADLERKGGRLLLQAFQLLRRRLAPGDPDVELHLVTPERVAGNEGVVIHRGLRPNSEELRDLYHKADIFALPTKGDCLPMVLSEAGAAGLPLVSTAVGAIPEIVKNGETGFIVDADDASRLADVLNRLVTHPELRQEQGRHAADLVHQHYDATKNARRLVDVLLSTARDGHRGMTHGQRRPMSRTPGPHREDTSDARGLLTVSGNVPKDLARQIELGVRPRPDYLVMAQRLGADLLDWDRARERGGRTAALLEKLAGPNIALAWTCFRLRRHYTFVFTDGEQIGIPFAILTRLAGKGGSRHLMIGHILSVPKKSVLFRAFRLGGAIDAIYVYSSAQQQYLQDELRVPADQVELTPFMVDTRFFEPQPPPPGHPSTICSAGLEYRDYPTLLEAVRGLDVRVVLAAASPWSKRPDTTEGADVPPNVEVCSLGFAALRRLYVESSFVVMPLEDVPFQAGVTTILEAMAMGKAVICSATTGQTDVVVDGETGLYVTPGNPSELRSAIETLLRDPERAARMGAAGRRRVERHMDVDLYADRLARRVHRYPLRLPTR